MIQRLVCRVRGHRWAVSPDRHSWGCTRCRKQGSWLNSIAASMYPPGA